MLYVIIILIVAGVIAFYMGPRTPVNTDISFDPSTIGDDVDVYLSKAEAKFDDIREGLHKQVVWAYPNSRARTPISLVYVHGFSASSGETRPLMDIVASAIGANLFYTRLTGHGRTGDAMAEATVHSWVNDIAEATAIGRQVGDRVILVGTSSGGTLVTWAATQPGQGDNIAGIINISPNYGPQHSLAWLLTMPWAKQMAEFVEGKNRGFEPQNELHEKLWTHEYPTAAVLPLAELIKLANNASIEDIKSPALFIFSDKDAAVKPEATRAIIDRWGADKVFFTVENSGDKRHHNIVGDALSPGTTQEVADKIIDWINALPDGDG